MYNIFYLFFQMWIMFCALFMLCVNVNGSLSRKINGMCNNGMKFIKHYPLR